MVAEEDGEKGQVERVVKIALCLPWYAGADRDCVTSFLAFQHYLGRLQERQWWKSRETPTPVALPNLDEVDKYHPEHSLRNEQFEFAISDETGCSLPGLARERAVDNALAWGADYILMYDADMVFPTSLLLRLFLDQKPIVAALAFTSRDPITPVIYTFKEMYQEEANRLKVEVEVVHDYQPDTLQQVDAVGFGVVLIKADVFRQIEKPWFNSPGMGEDIFFCMRAAQQGIEVWVDTRAKTLHKPTFHPDERWASEMRYLRERRQAEDADTDAESTVGCPV